ncbi:MAG: galactokinase family protein [Gemmatimonadaceae bacterium]
MNARPELFAAARDALASLGTHGDEELAWFVPGRIEVLGKHTDYAGGRSLLCAVDRGFAVVARPRSDAVVRVVDALRSETRELVLGDDAPLPQGDWGRYVAAVTKRVPRDFPAMRRGADIAFASNLPPASGMSSSSALLIAIFLVLRDANALDLDLQYRRIIHSREALGGYLGAVENGREFGALAAGHGVGTLGGSQDQTAILCCHADALTGYSFVPVRPEGDVPFPMSHAFVVAYSGVAAEKTAAAMQQYNEASLAVVRILEHLNRETGASFGSLGDAAAHDHAGGFRDLLRNATTPGFTRERLVARYEQFVAEANHIIPAAGAAMIRGDLREFGRLVDRSHHNAETLLGNQVPETIALQRFARELGADASSAFGAGFGGSVWAMTTRSNADRLASAWRERYAAAFPAAAERAQFIVTTPSAGASRA